jgi:hypothetical protein
MARSTSFKRKLSSDEVARGSLLIEKGRWSLFPPPGTPFELEAGGVGVTVRIEAEDCNCVPPPHQHYHLPLGALREVLPFVPGTVLIVEQLGEGRYAVRPA